MEIELNPRWWPNKIKTYIYYHGPRPISIICHLRDPPTFSLLTTFKHYFLCMAGKNIAYTGTVAPVKKGT
jgi:hypothetical protein